MTEQEFAETVRTGGGRAFLVGGYVRDTLRGVPPNDRDYLVCGLTEDYFLTHFPKARCVGKSFPVYHLNIDGENCEVAFARRERKNGRGYRGFNVVYDPTVTVEEDLWRRDLTMNSMALELPERNLIDPYGGRTDIAAGLIRATSAEHFSEDPVRALRAARQGAQHGFSVTHDTVDLMRKCGEELELEPPSRLLHELTLALGSPRPSIFFRNLAAADLLEVAFPEIARLIGKIQPVKYHPEGDAFEHTMLAVDKAASLTTNLTARFAALAHDLGKGRTPVSMLPHHYGHDQRGLDVLAAWNRRMTLPKTWMKAASLVISEHMRGPRLTKPSKIIDLLLKVDKSVMSVTDFVACLRADHDDLPIHLVKAEEIVAAVTKISGRHAPHRLKGAEVGGWVRRRQTEIYQKICAEPKQTDEQITEEG